MAPIAYVISSAALQLSRRAQLSRCERPRSGRRFAPRGISPEACERETPPRSGQDCALLSALQRWKRRASPRLRACLGTCRKSAAPPTCLARTGPCH